VTISGCTVHKIEKPNDNAHAIGVWGTEADSPYKNVRIEGNEIYDCLLGQSEALVLNGNVTDFVVVRNSVHDNDNIGIDMIGFEQTASANDQARNGVCSDNTVYNCSSEENPTYMDPTAGGIYVDGGRNIVIERNIVYGCDLGIEVASEHTDKTTDSVIVRNNLVHSCKITGIALGGYDVDRGWAVGCTFVNNTLVRNDTQQHGNGEILIQRSRNNVVQNNVIVTNDQNYAIVNTFGSAHSTGNAVDYNLYFGVGPAADMEWTWQDQLHTGFDTYTAATGQDAHSLYGAPLFADTAAGDYSIRDGSPATDKGTGTGAVYGDEDLAGNPRTVGAAVDIGAFELQSSAVRDLTHGVRSAVGTGAGTRLVCRPGNRRSPIHVEAMTVAGRRLSGCSPRGVYVATPDGDGRKF
jgi:hypothetical protein